MSDKNFVVENGIARYTGEPDAFFILEAVRAAQRLAATEVICGFEATVPNTDFLNEFGVYTELKARGFRILRSGEGSTVIGLLFIRTSSISIEVEQRNQPAVPQPMDLSHRRIV